jgi:DNA modification methylase
MPKREAKRTPVSSVHRTKKSATADGANAVSTSLRALSGLLELRGQTKNEIAWEVHVGDVRAVLATFAAERFACSVTSPPYYWQRDYRVDGQIGKEPRIQDYVMAIADAMDEVRRVLKQDGVLFLNLGDTYYSAKGQPKGNDPKNRARRFGLRAVDASGLGVPRKTAIGIPWRVALEMIERGWILRSPIVWRRQGSLPEPTAKDRPWRTYEMIFMFAKSPRYYFDRDSLGAEEDVWTISARPKNNNGLHSAAFPDELVERCIKIGCPEVGEVLDPFAGSGTVLRVAAELGHPAVGIDISMDYCEYAAKQLHNL